MAILLAAGAAVLAGSTSGPMHWYLRFPLLLGGLLAGTAAGAGSRPNLLRSLRAGALLLLWCAIAKLGLRYLTQSALPYFAFDPAHFGDLWSRRFWLMAHIGGGMTALLLGPWQFVTGFRSAAPAWHSWTGRIYVGGIALAAGSAFHLANHISPDEGGRISGLSMDVLALVWLATTGIGLRQIWRRQVTSHRAWMMRSYGVTLAFVNIRWLIDVPRIRQLAPLPQLVPVVIWVSWLLPLAVVEVLVRLRQDGRAAAPGGVLATTGQR